MEVTAKIDFPINTIMKRTLFLASSLLLGLLSISFAQDNLLKNPDFTISTDQGLEDWQFSTWHFSQNPLLAKQVEWKVVDEEDGSKVLSIVSTSPIKANLWWQQRLNITGSGNYELSVQVKAKGKDDAARITLGVGIYFLDADGQWISYEQFKPTSSVPSGEWEEVRGTVLAPENATTLTVRLGADFEGEVAIYFKSPVLTVE
jgi:hypothetical protein